MTPPPHAQQPVSRRTVPHLPLLLLLAVPLLLIGALRLLEGGRAPHGAATDPEPRAAGTPDANEARVPVADEVELPASSARDAATREAVALPEGAPAPPTDRRGLFSVPPGTPADESTTLIAGFPWSYDPPRTVELGADGSFLLRDVPEGPVTFSLTARYLRLPGELADEVDGVLVLRPELHARLTGRVATSFELEPGSTPEVWLGRLPATFAEWTAWKRNRSAREPSWIAQAAVHEGRFAFDAVLADAPLVVAATAPGGLVERLRVRLAPGETRDVVLTLAAAATVAGTLVGGEQLDPSEFRLAIKRPVPGLDPELASSWGTWHTAEFDAFDGSFRVEGLQPGRLRLVARGPTYGELELEARPGTTEGLLLVVGRTGALRGTVVWSDGTPIDAEFDVQVVASHPRSGSHRSALEGTEFEMDGLTAGLRLTLTAKCLDAEGGYIGHAERVEVVAPASALALRIPRPAHVAGRVRLPDGSPAPGASVLGLGGRDVRCDARGEFRSPVQSGVVALSASAEGLFPGAALWLELAPGEQREGLVLDLAGSVATLKGQLLGENGSPLAGTWFMLDVSAVGADRFSRTSVRTDETGSFEVTDLRPGRVAVHAILTGTQPDDTPIEVRFGPNGELVATPQNRTAGPVEVDLQPGDTNFVQLWL